MRKVPKPVCNILITSAGLATAINVIDAVRSISDIRIRIVAVDMNPLSAGLFISDAYHIVPSVKDQNYIDEILSLCKKEHIDLIIPLYSGEIRLFSENTYKFAQINVKLFVPPPEVVKSCTDKRLFLRFLEGNSFPYPKTYDPVLDSDMQYPLFIKPIVGSSSKNTHILYNNSDLEYHQKKYPDSILQEYVVGKEYTVDCLVYRDVVYAAVPRSRLVVKDGKSVVGRIEEDPGVIELTTSLLLKLGMSGPCNVQIIKANDGSLAIIEINPRLAAGGLPLSIRAGANIPEMMIKLALNADVVPVTKYKTDIYMIRYLTDIFVTNTNGNFRRV